MSFVIRLWLEPREVPTPPEWRWHVRHIQSGTEAYFRDMVARLRFIEETAANPPPTTVPASSTPNAAYLRENAAQVARMMQALGMEPALGSWEQALCGDLGTAYLATFGHTISKESPPYEAEYGQADIFQKLEALADIGGFYRAFGVEPRLLERLDHRPMVKRAIEAYARRQCYTDITPEVMAQARERMVPRQPTGV